MADCDGLTAFLTHITTQIYAGRPLTDRQARGTSVAMIDRHYAGAIGHWDGHPVRAESRFMPLAKRVVW